MNFIVVIVVAILKFVDTKYSSNYCQSGRNLESFNSTALPTEILVSMEKGERKQYHFQINAPTPIKITFSSCTNIITSKLYYNQSIQIAKAASSLIVQCAPAGRYDLVLMAKYSCSFELKTIFHHPYDDWPLLSLIEPSKMKYQSRIKNREMVIKWNRSKLDIHVVHYCLAISTKRNQHSLCEAITHSAKADVSKQLCLLSSLNHLYHKNFRNVMKLDPDPELVTISCEGKRNRLTVKGLVPNKRYFIDLFGVHTKLENLTFLLNSSSMWFNRSRPSHIKENSLTTFQVPLSGRPVAFTYKIPMHSTCRQMKLFTIPCGRNIRLKIISKLNNNATVMELHKSETIVLNSRPQEKFVFKLSTNEMFNGRSSRKIKVLLGCSDSFTHLQLPRNISLQQNLDETDCTTTSISWNPSPDQRPDIWYCIYLIEINQRGLLFEDHFLSNACIGTSQSHPNLYQMECIQNPVPASGEIRTNQRIHHTLTQLNPERYYAVYVMLRSNNISLPYDKLLINTNSMCAFEFKTYRDNHGSIIPYDLM
ncbi:uncharacterized protein LOC119066114 [Bradysia coprophila]|uniref:uncharacterized protein LOC119066114 n=1 Tax=Bradysia coprophila TaxID=38358 RepID=UPI00187DA3E0|nr:uncharacterized protein LOC119066114 [Bradysia coprophila]